MVGDINTCRRLAMSPVLDGESLSCMAVEAVDTMCDVCDESMGTERPSVLGPKDGTDRWELWDGSKSGEAEVRGCVGRVGQVISYAVISGGTRRVSGRLDISVLG